MRLRPVQEDPAHLEVEVHVHRLTESVKGWFGFAVHE
jgi:hypothetical protein